MTDRWGHLPHVVAALSKRGIPESIIGFYVQRWEVVNQLAPSLPCPSCFFGGNSGTLLPSPGPANGKQLMRCSRCDEKIEVPAD